MSSTIKNFIANRDNLIDYKNVLDLLKDNYVRTDDYVSLNKDERNKIMDCVYELKSLIDSLISEKINKPPNPVVVEAEHS